MRQRPSFRPGVRRAGLVEGFWAETPRMKVIRCRIGENMMSDATGGIVLENPLNGMLTSYACARWIYSRHSSGC